MILSRESDLTSVFDPTLRPLISPLPPSPPPPQTHDKEAHLFGFEPGPAATLEAPGAYAATATCVARHTVSAHFCPDYGF